MFEEVMTLNIDLIWKGHWKRKKMFPTNSCIMQRWRNGVQRGAKKEYFASAFGNDIAIAIATYSSLANAQGQRGQQQEALLHCSFHSTTMVRRVWLQVWSKKGNVSPLSLTVSWQLSAPTEGSSLLTLILFFGIISNFQLKRFQTDRPVFISHPNIANI